MNILRRSNLRLFFNYSKTPAKSEKIFIVEPLSQRALIRVQGTEVVPFLQGLTTNDMNHLHTDKNPSMFTMFLNNAGRVLYDSIVYRTPNADTFIIECDHQVVDEFIKMLRMFRVRRKISVESVTAELSPWVIFSPTQNTALPIANEKRPKEVLSTPDPRFKELGMRVIQPARNSFKDIKAMFPNATLQQSTSSIYNTHRYVYGVGEGVTDHPPGKCFPLEANCDFLNGVSFQKGCYVGQELTARVYHTGVIRKRLMPMEIPKIPESKANTVQIVGGTAVGTIRGVSENHALALLRVEKVLKAETLLVNGECCKTYKPHWWPKELPTQPSSQSK